MIFKDLLKLLPDTYSSLEIEQIESAFNFSNDTHSGQTRVSGEPYFTHCVAVAQILADLKVPAIVITAALLHDTVEDTDVTIEEIKERFGEEVASLVDGVTKLSNLPRISRADQHPKKDTELPGDEDLNIDIITQSKSRRQDLKNETLRKTLMAMGNDVRIVLIKLADRLHNMRTLSYMPPEKRSRIAQETLDIFAPLANRLGIWQIKWELEDLGFRYTKPDEYKQIAEKLSDRRVIRESEVEKIISNLRNLLDDAGINAQISGRPKHIYSIYTKMIRKEKPFELVRDVRGVRLIVPDIPACYAALGVIHTNWRPIPNEFDDYIAAPKDNFYKSLHTAVIYTDGKPLEVQIRTPKMDQDAEYGIAAHWLYKEMGTKDDHYQQRVNWLRRLMETRQDIQDAQEFVDGVKSDVFEDRVYAFTPRGDIIDLSLGSTTIDFAYAVHTEVGNRCRGAKVNGKLVSLDYKLKTGDQVEILTAKSGGPSRDWLNSHLGLVNSQRARAKIRQYFKKQNRDQNLSQGKNLLEKEFHKLSIPEIDIDKIASAFGFKSSEDMFVAIGCGDLSIRKIINHLHEVEERKDDPLFPIRTDSLDRKDSNSVNVLGLKGLLTNYAKCCNPAPGDDIVGYITRGRGATIHRKDCPNILRMKDRDRIVKVTWGEAKRTFPVMVQINAFDRQGLMGDISTILSNEGVNMRDIDTNFSNNFANIKILLDVGDINQLSKILTLTESLPNVMQAFRIKPG
jgi:GTP diphosphokinase / guanosine-3',5'-bis(diphosphate) 3'-diphosphatase